VVRSLVVVRPLVAADGPVFVAAAERSRALHGRWVSAPRTAAAFREHLARFVAPASHGFVVALRDGGELVGAIQITNVVMGAFRSGYLSYYAFAGHERRGLMKQALRQACRIAFGRLGLHRLEANIQPGNVASIALVRACGFAREGYSPRYLKIGGRWRDHERWALLADG
jgi:ribosomal-protein-alanine N-acetyltransferase